MRAVFLTLLIFALAACGQATPIPAAPSHVEAASLLEAKTVGLVGYRKDGELHAYCSGVWVSGYTILTANHCVNDLELQDGLMYVVKSDVYAPNELSERNVIKPHGALLLARDEAHDLALVQALVPPMHGTATLSVEVVRAGMPVQAMGQPLGLWWSYSRGDVAAVRITETLSEPMVFIQTTTPISPGSSGGGLFDEWGQLVGIAHASYTRGQNANLFVHWQYADALLRKAGT